MNHCGQPPPTTCSDEIYTCFVLPGSAFDLMLHCGIFLRCVACQLWYLHITRLWLMVAGCYSYMESAVRIMAGRCTARMMLRLLINSGHCTPKPSPLVLRCDKHGPNNSPNNELTPMCPVCILNVAQNAHQVQQSNQRASHIIGKFRRQQPG